MSFIIERSMIQRPHFGGSTIGGSIVHVHAYTIYKVLHCTDEAHLGQNRLSAAALLAPYNVLVLSRTQYNVRTSGMQSLCLTTLTSSSSGRREWHLISVATFFPSVHKVSSSTRLRW